jgi:iron complex outermembrane receptor protein
LAGTGRTAGISGLAASGLDGSGVAAGAATAGAVSDGTGVGASFNFPYGVAVIPSSEAIVVSDQNNHRIRLVTPFGVVSTLAGSGTAAFADGAGTDAPTIHGLGASASNSTLILIDGHRLPLSGINHTLADPNILAPLALERVEVLADGASSVYGSDAVAGVINFITRRKFNGLEIRAQAGTADSYHTYSAAGVAGKTWDTGSVLVALGYSDRSNLLTGDRDFTKRDRRAIGGTNLASFNCSPASIQVGAGNIIPAPYTGAGVANAAANSFCDYSGVADLVPAEKRYSGMMKVTQEVTDALTVSADVVYSDRKNVAKNSRGTVTATIFGPGAASTSQINPFFQAPAGVTATTEQVRFDANDLFGPGAKTDGGEETGYFHGSAEYKLGDSWRATAGGTVGFSNSFTKTTGGLNGSAALLALNGTTNGGGSLTAVSVPGTNIIVTQALNAGNALDVFNTGSANRTSAATRAKLIDNLNVQKARQTLKDFTFKVDGSLIDLPAGPLKAAFGAEYIKYTLAQDSTQANNTGPASTGSSSLHLDYDRDVQSAYAEFLVPVVNPGMNIPLVRSLDFNVSGRLDKYSDFGNTQNPRIGANWGVVEGLTVRANWAKSFVAPALTSRGADANGTTAETSIAGGPTLSVPTAAYPTMIGGIPGCNVGAVTCNVGGTVTGLQINGGNANVGPQRGKSFSFGADWNPVFVPHLRLSATYWTNKLTGAVTAPQAAFAVNAAGLNNLLTIYPGGATPAQISQIVGSRPLNTTIPAVVYYTYNFQQRNALNLDVAGVDLQANYSIETDLGRFGVDAIASIKTKFDQQVGTGGAVFSVLGTTGFNTTFPSIKNDTRLNLSWESKFGLSADITWNHTGEYKNWSGTTVTPLVRNAQGVPTGGGDTVEAGNFYDLHVDYNFNGDSGFTSGLQLFLDVNNILDTDPPFYNSNNGYDTFSGNPLGRQISGGFRKKF